MAAAEDAAAFGTKTVGAFAQVNGGAIGFNVFTPTADVAYRLFVRGQDAASGAPSNGWLDELTVVKYAGTVTINVLHSTTLVGAPGARTWSDDGGGALKLVVANGTTWYIDVVVIRFPA